MCSVTAIELVYLFRTDWATAVEQAEARMRSDANNNDHK